MADGVLLSAIFFVIFALFFFHEKCDFLQQFHVRFVKEE